MNDLQEQLSGTRIEDEDRTVDGLRGQITLERLVNGNTIHVGVVDEQLNLVAEELCVILRV